MRIITSREFREKQRAYLELAEREKVIIHRGKNRKPVLLTPLSESEESDIYLSDPQIIASIQRGIEDIRAGRVTRIKDPKNIWESIL